MDNVELLGQKMCIGLEGTMPNEQFCRLVETYKIGNVILFRANLVNAQQARLLCDAIQDIVQAATGYPAFITIDQEGGMVSRLPDDMLTTPGAMALAATGDETCAYHAAALTAMELRRIGANFNLAPVLDVNANAKNPVIGVRSYGDTPETVIAFSNKAIEGYLANGILCAGKHFPGHGDTQVDSHIALPTVNKSREELEACEIKPFRSAIQCGIPAIMTSHILFPALEAESVPATMSRRIITGLLKEELGFKGLVLSDGMEMGAIREFYGTEKGCVKALQAGVDIVFVCHGVDSMESSMQAIQKAYEQNELNKAETQESIRKILQYKRELAAQPRTHVVASTEDNLRLMKRTISLYGTTKKRLPSLGQSPLVVAPLSYRSTIASTAPDTSLCFADWFADALGGMGQNWSVKPNDVETTRALHALEGATGLLVATYNGHLNKEQLVGANALVSRAKQKGIPAIAVALRNPYDLEKINPYADRLAAFEYSQTCFQALLSAVKGEYIPCGHINLTMH